MKTGKFIYNFRMSFVTLTLPSKQTTSDLKIKSKSLNQFLIELRKYYDVKNFVWKAELQKNENIHFHLILDKYVDYQALRRRWNRILEKDGYVTAYREKFSNMSLNQYHTYRNLHRKCDFKKSSIAYAQGMKTRWKSPNSVDVKSVKSKKELASYLAKYVSKSVSTDPGALSDDKRQIEFGRSWSRSYSLAKLKYQNKFSFDDLQELITYFYNTPKKIKYYAGQFFEVFFFTFDSLSDKFKRLIEFYIKSNAKLYNYPIP
ncbi:MAG: hypothetical protein GY756_10200 [bacterium]|nr:hypothetical protein [bacterium]